MVKISAILPSRDRPDSLHRMYNSLVNLAYDARRIEILVAYDEDDKKMVEFPLLPLMHLHKTRRLNSIAAYQNWLWPMAIGDYFFVLNDDTEIVTKNWDEMILSRMTTLNYGQTSPCGMWGGWYSEFPVVGRKAAKRLGYLMPPHFRSHGADHHLYRIFNGAKLVINLRDLIVVHKTPEDDTHRHIRRISDDRTVDHASEIRLLMCPPIKLI